MKNISLYIALTVSTYCSCQTLTEIEIYSQSEFKIEQANQNRKDTINLFRIFTGLDTISQIVDQNGNELNYQNFINKVILLDFWFLECKPCIAELSGFSILKNKFKNQDFILVTITPDSIEKLNNTILRNSNQTFSIIPGSKLLQRHSYPLKMIIDKSGKLRELVYGGSIDNDAHIKLVNKISPLIEKWLAK